VGDLIRHPSLRDQSLACVPLYLQRADEAIELPDDDVALQPGDQLLFAGRGNVRQQQQPVLRNPKIRDYVITGKDPPTSWLWERLQRSR